MSETFSLASRRLFGRFCCRLRKVPRVPWTATEAAELLEHFQWLTEKQSSELPAQAREAVGEEMADVLLYLLQLADKLDVDLIQAAQRKLDLNARKYPVESSRGHSRKYNSPA